jgi:pyridoxal phosphate enzyme (YggS family)
MTISTLNLINFAKVLNLVILRKKMLKMLVKLINSLPKHVKLIAVSKNQSCEAVLEVYKYGQQAFGENRVQELLTKYEQLPRDIEWHLIGHLQSNKVKYIAPFVHLIHSVDSLKLLQEINKQALKNNRIIACLLQIYIAQEETKFGLSFEEAEQIIYSDELQQLSNINITGFMGMASNTDNQNQIRKEYSSLYSFFYKHSQLTTHNPAKAGQGSQLTTLSMGMSGDYQIAIEEGSNMIRIGSLIFGER